MIFLDVHESEELEKLISRRVEVQRFALNTMDLADIFWTGLDGTHQQEHKAVDEILDNEDSVEEQLQRQYPHAKHCGLIVRYLAVPSRGGTTIFHPMAVKLGFKRKWHSGSPHLRYAAWLEAIRTVGIDVIEVPTLEAVAWRVIAMYEHSMRQDHRVLERHIHPKLNISARNPHILALMGISQAFGVGIGEDKATKLIGRYGTISEVLSSDVESLCKTEGVGKLTAEKLLQTRNPRAKKPQRRNAGGLSVTLYKGSAPKEK